MSTTIVSNLPHQTCKNVINNKLFVLMKRDLIKQSSYSQHICLSLVCAVMSLTLYYFRIFIKMALLSCHDQLKLFT